MADTLDIEAIERLLPHRYPFLLIDRVIEVDGDKVVALKNVTINEPFFAGHFPGHPVMPGVLIVEAMAQAGAVLALRARAEADAATAANATSATSSTATATTPILYFMALDKVKFRKPVVPGDQLRLEVLPLRKGGSVWKMKGRALVDGQVVCEAEFLASVVARKG